MTEEQLKAALEAEQKQYEEFVSKVKATEAYMSGRVDMLKELLKQKEPEAPNAPAA